MQLRNGKHVLDAYRPTFDPHLDIATVVFSHVQCVKTRHSLALVSKLWRDASKPAAAYPLRFDFDAFPHMTQFLDAANSSHSLLDNDEALSLPYERVVGLLGEVWDDVCSHAAIQGSVRLLKWTRENNRAWDTWHVLLRSQSWTLARSPVLARERVPLGPDRGHVLLGRPLQTLGLPAVRGG